MVQVETVSTDSDGLLCRVQGQFISEHCGVKSRNYLSRTCKSPFSVYAVVF
jgi:hypothetical protein